MTGTIPQKRTPFHFWQTINILLIWLSKGYVQNEMSSGGVAATLFAREARGPGFDSRSRRYDFRNWFSSSCFPVAIWLKYHWSNVYSHDMDLNTVITSERRLLNVTLCSERVQTGLQRWLQTLSPPPPPLPIFWVQSYTHMIWSWRWWSPARGVCGICILLGTERGRTGTRRWTAETSPRVIRTCDQILIEYWISENKKPWSISKSAIRHTITWFITWCVDIFRHFYVKFGIYHCILCTHMFMTYNVWD